MMDENMMKSYNIEIPLLNNPMNFVNTQLTGCKSGTSGKHNSSTLLNILLIAILWQYFLFIPLIFTLQCLNLEEIIILIADLIN
jgi:hypothetical protein